MDKGFKTIIVNYISYFVSVFTFIMLLSETFTFGFISFTTTEGGYISDEDTLKHIAYFTVLLFIFVLSEVLIFVSLFKLIKTDISYNTPTKSGKTKLKSVLKIISIIFASLSSIRIMSVFFFCFILFYNVFYLLGK